MRRTRGIRTTQILASLFGIYLLLNIGFSLAIYGTVQFAILPGIADTMLSYKFGNTAKGSGIKNADDPGALRRHAKMLERISSPQKVAATAQTLDIVFFKSRPEDGVFPDISLSFGERWSRGATLIPDQGVRFVLDENAPQPGAAFGVESVITFDVANAKKGVLAGFNVNMLGGRGALTPHDLDRAQKKFDDHDFCSTVDSWADFHQVTLSNVRVWDLGYVREIRLDGPHRIIGDAGASSVAAIRLCKPTN